MSADRRRFMTALASAGLAGGLFPGALWALRAARRGDGPDIDVATIEAAEKIAGIVLRPEQREALVESLRRAALRRADLRPIDNAVAPAFDRLAVRATPTTSPPWTPPKDEEPPRPPASDVDLAFMSALELGRCIRHGVVTSERATRLFLDRLERFDPKLKCVITLTRERALAQARAADADVESGRTRSALHGVPWGAKDIIALSGHRTTWGAKPFENQMLDETATVVERLDAAGCVLLGKLSVGALAMGDVWFGGKTRNPWNVEQGSSGSSAGSAAAVAAGLAPFALGTETLGSIVSPSTRCGVTGLRPTFGRVPRSGVMALAWTMDKVGPIARHVADCEAVLELIAGPDGRDRHVADRDFRSEFRRSEIRVGFLEGAFERSARDTAVLDVLRDLGYELKPISIPAVPEGMMEILDAEAGAAFDEITRDGRVDQLVRQDPRAWPTTFRRARFIPAVEYIQASRRRTVLQEAMEASMEGVDVLVSPTFRGGTLRVTNFTGHPCVCLPNGFANGLPRSITFLGRLFGERDLVAVAAAYQGATDHHLRRPPVGS